MEPLYEDPLHKPHMLLFACKTVHSAFMSKDDGSSEKWHCPAGSNHSSASVLSPDGANVCMIIYPIPGFEMPADTGFHVGGDSGFDYVALVLHQHLHGAELQSPDAHMVTKEAGITVYMEDVLPGKPVTRAAVLSSDAVTGVLPAQSVTFILNQCLIKDDILIHPLAIHFHAHESSISGRIWKQAKDGSTIDLLVIRASSLIDVDLMVDHTVTLSAGDWLMSRCEYNNTSKETIRIG